MTLIFTNAKERGRFIRFAIVGVVGSVVDFGIFNLLAGFFLVSAVTASVISFVAAVASNFTWNRLWTYPDSRSKPVSRQLFEFTIISLIGLAIRTPIFVLSERLFTRWFYAVSLRVVSPEFLAHNLALTVAIIVVFFWNFFVNRFWTYSDVGS